jgi:hypothetical protein
MERAAEGSRLAYQAQECRLTLAEGLAEYYAANRGRVTRPDDLPEDSAALFRSHDQCHVVFGLDTSLADETLADLRTVMSSDVGWGRYVRYLRQDAAAKAAFGEVGWRAIAATALRCLPRIARAAFEAMRSRKRWPWVPPRSYASRRLDDLRREYGIRVI